MARIVTKTLKVTSGTEIPEIIDITDKVQKLVRKSGVKSGQVLAFSQHTTAALTIQENEKGLLEDLKETICKLLPPHKPYKHNLAPSHNGGGEPPNGHAHLQHCLLGGSSEVIPLLDGEMLLGTYQRIFLIELDRARERTVVIQVIGE